MEFGSAPRQSERKFGDYKKWKLLQEKVNEVYHDTQNRIGFYIEFLEYISTHYRKEQLQTLDSKV